MPPESVPGVTPECAERVTPPSRIERDKQVVVMRALILILGLVGENTTWDSGGSPIQRRIVRGIAAPVKYDWQGDHDETMDVVIANDIDFVCRRLCVDE